MPGLSLGGDLGTKSPSGREAGSATLTSTVSVKLLDTWRKMVGRGGLLSVLGPLGQALAAPGSASREDSPLTLFPGQEWLSPH